MDVEIKYCLIKKFNLCEKCPRELFNPLGVVHNCHHFHERTQRTLFCDPLPPSQKRTF